MLNEPVGDPAGHSGNVTSAVADKGGTEAFFDAAVAVAALATDLQNLVGYAYLYFEWSDPGDRVGRGRGMTRKAQNLLRDANGVDGPLMMAVKAFAGQAPILMGDQSQVSGTAGGASLVSVVDRYSTTL